MCARRAAGVEHVDGHERGDGGHQQHQQRGRADDDQLRIEDRGQRLVDGQLGGTTPRLQRRAAGGRQ